MLSLLLMMFRLHLNKVVQFPLCCYNQDLPEMEGNMGRGRHCERGFGVDGEGYSSFVPS